MKYLRLALILFTAVIAFVSSLNLLSIHQDSHAQGSGVEIVKVLNKDSNVVRVGERLTFTIALTNHSSFTLTSVTLIDQYRNDIMAYAEADPAADTVDTATGRIVWNNVATPSIPSGQSIRVTVSFTAEHPSPAVVNFARAEDVIHSGGSLSITSTTEITQEAVGGSAPIFKRLWPPGLNPVAGLPVTFTHHITNDGLAVMTSLPLTDTYDASFLEFNFAIPSATITIPPGILVWNDLTDYFGDLNSFETVVVTTVFTALLDISNTVNSASTEGARDEYGNDLAGGEALVPIVIIPQPTNTPQPEPTPQEPESSTDTPAPPVTATPVPTVTATPAPTFTPSPTPPAFPSRLPETGNTSSVFRLLWLGGILLFVGSIILFQRKKRLM